MRGHRMPGSVRQSGAWPPAELRNRPADRAEPGCPAGRPRGMRPHLPCAPSATLLLAAAAAVTVAGCAATRTTTGPAMASRTPRERAVADAAAILKAFAVPPGAQRLQKAPDVLKVPVTTLVSTTLVDDVSFWRAPGVGPHVLAISDSRRAERPGPGGRGGRSGRRADRDPGGRPGELAAVAAGRRTGTDCRPRGHDHPAAQPGPARQASARTGHDHRTGGRPAARGAGRQPPAVHDRTGRILPGAPGGGIRLTFLARAGGLPLAVAQGPAACGTVQFSVGGKQQPALQLTDSFLPQVLKLADLNWNVP